MRDDGALRIAPAADMPEDRPRQGTIPDPAARPMADPDGPAVGRGMLREIRRIGPAAPAVRSQGFGTGIDHPERSAPS